MSHLKSALLLVHLVDYSKQNIVYNKSKKFAGPIGQLVYLSVYLANWRLCSNCTCSDVTRNVN